MVSSVFELPSLTMKLADESLSLQDGRATSYIIWLVDESSQRFDGEPIKTHPVSRFYHVMIPSDD